MIDPTMISLPAAPAQGNGGPAKPAADLKADPQTDSSKPDAAGQPFASLLVGEAPVSGEVKATKPSTGASSDTPAAEELAAAIVAAAAALVGQQQTPPAATTPAAGAPVEPAADVSGAANAAVLVAAPSELAPAPAVPAPAKAKEAPAPSKGKQPADTTQLAPAADQRQEAPAAPVAAVKQAGGADTASRVPATDAAVLSTEIAAATQAVQNDPAAALLAAANATDVAQTAKKAVPVKTAAGSPKPSTSVPPVLATGGSDLAAAAAKPATAAAAEGVKGTEKTPAPDARRLEHERGADARPVAPLKSDQHDPPQGETPVLLTTIGRSDHSEFARIIGSVSGERVPASQLPEAIVNHVAELGGKGGGEIIFRLDPAGLGQLQIHVSVVDGKVDASIVASSSQVATALQQSLSDLTTALTNRGLDVGSFNVGADAAGGGKREQNANGRHSSHRPGSADTSSTGSAPATRLTAVTSPTQLEVLA